MIAKSLLKQHLMDQIRHSDHKLTRVVVTRILSEKLGVDRKDIADAINDLIAEKELAYTYIFGNSYLEKSFNRPVRISPSVVVKPENIRYEAMETDIVIDIVPGISFGSGDHPTTCLCVQAIEHVLKDRQGGNDCHGTDFLDIGTGSGILSIVAAKFGMEKVTGIDIDPCAINEARNNVRINGLESRIRIFHPDHQPESAAYSFVAANLRFPDIMTLCPFIERKARSRAPVVLSGLRPEECNAVLERYTNTSFKPLAKTQKKNWACLTLQKE